MLNLWGRTIAPNCEGTSRRNFMKVGALGMSGLGLPGLLRNRAQASQAGKSVKDTSVIWLWLGGGPTHIETFDPKMEAPVEFRSAVGSLKTSVPGIEIGGLFPKMAQMAHKMAFVRSFTHGNSGHSGGTHYVMTGVDHPPADAGQAPIRPSMGAITSRVRGTNNPKTGVPTYVGISGLYADGANWLGVPYGPFYTSGEARNNMNLNVPLNRL